MSFILVREVGAVDTRRGGRAAFTSAEDLAAGVEATRGSEHAAARLGANEQ